MFRDTRIPKHCAQITSTLLSNRKNVLLLVNIRCRQKVFYSFEKIAFFSSSAWNRMSLIFSIRIWVDNKNAMIVCGVHGRWKKHMYTIQFRVVLGFFSFYSATVIKLNALHCHRISKIVFTKFDKAVNQKMFTIAVIQLYISGKFRSVLFNGGMF